MRILTLRPLQGGGLSNRVYIKPPGAVWCQVADQAGLRSLGFGVWSLGFRVWGLGFRGLGIQGFGV